MAFCNLDVPCLFIKKDKLIDIFNRLLTLTWSHEGLQGSSL